MMGDFVPLGKRALLVPHWDPIILLQAGPTEMHYTWNGTCTIEGGKVESWFDIDCPLSISSCFISMVLSP